MDLDALLGPDPFGDDPDAAARWTLECMAIERRIRAELRPIPDDRGVARKGGGGTGTSSSADVDRRSDGDSTSEACNASGVYPIVVLEGGARHADEGAYLGSVSPLPSLSAACVLEKLDPEETFDSSF